MRIADSSIIRIAIGGDFCPYGRPQSGLLDGSLTEESIVGSLRPLFSASDIGIVNLECPLTHVAESLAIAKSGPHARANPKMTRLLRHLGVTGVTMATNHIRDYGDAGVLETLQACTANNIATVGAGANLAQAREPLILHSKGRRVAFVNAVEQEFSSATASRAGANPLVLVDLLRDLRHARSHADHVIVIVHGGLEMTHCPSPESVKLLRFLAEQDVTAVVRHHSHFVQGHEVWNGVPIVYGLGNFLFDLGTQVVADWHLGLVVRLEIDEGGRSVVEVHPICQCDYSASVRLLEGEPLARELRRIEKFSKLIADEELLRRAWTEALEPRREDYFGKLIISSQVMRGIVRRLGLMRFVRPGARSARYWENLLKCDTHREALLDILRGESTNRKDR